MEFFLIAVSVVTLATIFGVRAHRISSRLLITPRDDLHSDQSAPVKLSRKAWIAKSIFVLAVIYAMMGFVCLHLFGYPDASATGFFVLAAFLISAWIAWGRKHS